MSANQRTIVGERQSGISQAMILPQAPGGRCRRCNMLVADSGGPDDAVSFSDAQRGKGWRPEMDRARGLQDPETKTPTCMSGRCVRHANGRSEERRVGK